MKKAIIIKGVKKVLDLIMVNTNELNDAGDFGLVIKRTSKTSISITTDKASKRDELADFLYDYNMDEYEGIEVIR